MVCVSELCICHLLIVLSSGRLIVLFASAFSIRLDKDDHHVMSILFEFEHGAVNRTRERQWRAVFVFLG